MKAARFPRFRRVPEITTMQLTERDRQIIRLVHRHRFLRSHHIIALVGNSPQQLLRRLRLLYHHGYLERPRAQIDYYHQGGSRRMVYGLGNKGAALLKREQNILLYRLDWGVKNRLVSRLFLEHALLVADVMVTFELACRQNGRVRLLTSEDFLLPDPKHRHHEPFQWKVNMGKGMKLGLVPDRVFGLEFPDQPPGRNRAFFFLEADRATMPVIRQNHAQSSFYRKLLAYEATWAQNIHRSQLGFHRFRVLTITTSPERVKHMVEACGQLERGHGLFLFTHVDFFRSHPDLFSLPWQTVRSGVTTTLLE